MTEDHTKILLALNLIYLFMYVHVVYKSFNTATKQLNRNPDSQDKWFLDTNFKELKTFVLNLILIAGLI